MLIHIYMRLRAHLRASALIYRSLGHQKRPLSPDCVSPSPFTCGGAGRRAAAEVDALAPEDAGAGTGGGRRIAPENWQ